MRVPVSDAAPRRDCTAMVHLWVSSHTANPFSEAGIVVLTPTDNRSTVRLPCGEATLFSVGGALRIIA